MMKFFVVVVFAVAMCFGVSHFFHNVWNVAFTLPSPLPMWGVSYMMLCFSGFYYAGHRIVKG